MSKIQDNDAFDHEMREFLFGEGGPLDTSPPVLPMLKKWTGSPRFHLDRSSELALPKSPQPLSEEVK